MAHQASAAYRPASAGNRPPAQTRAKRGARAALRACAAFVAAAALLAAPPAAPAAAVSSATEVSSGLSLIVGDFINFGKYNGAPILWRVLYTSGDRVMLFSEKILSLKPFDVTESNYWPDSNIREWMNSEADRIHPWKHKRPNGDYIVHRQNEYDEEPGFLSNANFTEADRHAIISTQRRATVSLKYETKSTGGGTVLSYEQIVDDESRVQVQDNLLYQTVADRVFFLTLREVKELLMDRKYPYHGYATPQALAKNETGLKDADTSTILSYWLQSPNFEDGSSLYTVNEHNIAWTAHSVVRGSFDGETNAKKDTVGIRPAMYINPSAVVVDGGSGMPGSPFKVMGTVESFTSTMSFTDVPESEWYHSYVLDAYAMGLMRGTSATKFNPEGNLTVAELLTTCLNLLNVDVDTSGQFVNWYDPYVIEATTQGLISTTDSFYRKLGDPVTRNEMAVIILRAVMSVDAESVVSDYSWVGNVLADSSLIPQRYRESVYKAYASGILKGGGEGMFNGESNLTRAEAATVMVRVKKKDFVLPPKS